MILKEYRGEGQYGDMTIELDTAIPDGSPVIKVEDTVYLVNIHDIVRAVAAEHCRGEEKP